MKRWFETIRFLWEEEAPPRSHAPSNGGPEPSGVPPSLRRATRFALIGFAAITLLTQIVGVRLVAPVDASPSYKQQCESGCRKKYDKCTADAQKDYQQCQKDVQARLRTCTNKCGDPNHDPKARKCILACQNQRPNLSDCQTAQHSGLTNCVATRDECNADCEQ